MDDMKIMKTKLPLIFKCFICVDYKGFVENDYENEISLRARLYVYVSKL